ncbi:hypothetical protein RB195_005807 [Necator americanus]|uniref:Uncharacterized protein n=1 Tax=Necator americanus TaxID=51031 RepID=A0ABR1BPP9_NECAM
MGLTPRFEMLDLIVLEKKGQPLLLRRFLNLESKHHQRNDEIVLLPPFHHLHQHSRIAGQLSYPTAAVEETSPTSKLWCQTKNNRNTLQLRLWHQLQLWHHRRWSHQLLHSRTLCTSTTINHALNFAKSYSKETGHTSDTAVIYEGGHFPFGHLPANRIFGDMHVDGPFRARKKLATKKAVLARINLEKKS